MRYPEVPVNQDRTDFMNIAIAAPRGINKPWGKTDVSILIWP